MPYYKQTGSQLTKSAVSTSLRRLFAKNQGQCVKSRCYNN